MPLPDIQDIFRPLLEELRDRNPHNLSVNDFMNIVSEYFGIGELSQTDKNLFKRRVIKAKDELKDRNFLTNPSNNAYIITSAGLNYLDNPEDPVQEVTPGSEQPVEVIESKIEPEVMEVAEAEVAEQTKEESPQVYEEIQPDPEPEEPEQQQEVTEASDDDITLEDAEDAEDESDTGIELEESEAYYETPSEGEDIAAPHEEPEPEQESESQEENESNTMNENQSIGIEDAIRIHNEELAKKVLSRISDLPAEMFEVFVIDMLSKMGYRAFQNARYTSEETGSDMIHGVIIDNKTGAPIYIHARKASADKTIGRADMQDFIDALSDKGGKGIFATTAKFSEQAEILATDERIMLIDGLKLAGLMVAHNFCIRVEKIYEIKEFDTESFREYQR